MTSQKSKTPMNGNGHATNGNGHATGFDALVELNTGAFNIFDEVAQNMLEGFEAYRQEAVRFVGHRLREDLEMPHNLASCWTPQEAFGVYLDFMQAAHRDYLEQASRFAKIGSKVAEVTVEDLEVEATGEVEPRRKRAKG